MSTTLNQIKLSVVLTHPIQYYASWFRYIEANAPTIALTVVHATEPTPDQQGVGFDRAFTWDVPLTAGYRSHTVRPSDPDDEIFLICAIDGEADYLVSDDHDLRNLKSLYEKPVIGASEELAVPLGANL